MAELLVAQAISRSFAPPADLSAEIAEINRANQSLQKSNENIHTLLKCVSQAVSVVDYCEKSFCNWQNLFSQVDVIRAKTEKPKSAPKNNNNNNNNPAKRQKVEVGSRTDSGQANRKLAVSGPAKRKLEPVAKREAIKQPPAKTPRRK